MTDLATACSNSGELVFGVILGAVLATAFVVPLVLWLCGYRPGLNT